MRIRKTLALTAAGAAAITLLVGGAHAGYRAHQNSQACKVIEQQLTDRGPVIRIAGSGMTVAVIGDSYSSGDGLDDYTMAWPHAFATDTGYALRVSGIGSTGFSNRGVCGDSPFSSRLSVTSGADLVIVQGGLNDTSSPDEVPIAAEELLREIEAPRVVVVGPVDAPAVEGEEAVDLALQEAAVDAGAEYISALDWQLTFGPDRTHLDPSGHREFAKLTEDALHLSSPSR